MGNFISRLRRAKRPTGSALSALAIALLPLGLQAATTAQQQIESAATSAMTAMIQDHAKRQDWKDMQLHLIHQVKGRTPTLPCQSEPTIQRAGNSIKPLARHRFSVRCDNPSWEASVTSQADISLPMVTSIKTLEKDQTIAIGDLRLVRAELGKSRRGFFTSLEAVAGQSAKRRIRAGQQLNPSLLDTPVLVRRGEKVKIVASQDGIRASANGEALADGRQGKVIRVRNMSSEKVIDAQVLEDGVVSSTFR